MGYDENHRTRTNYRARLSAPSLFQAGSNGEEEPSAAGASQLRSGETLAPNRSATAFPLLVLCAIGGKVFSTMRSLGSACKSRPQGGSLAWLVPEHRQRSVKSGRKSAFRDEFRRMHRPQRVAAEMPLSEVWSPL